MKTSESESGNPIECGIEPVHELEIEGDNVLES